MKSKSSRKPRGCLGWGFRILLLGIILVVILLVAGNIIQRRATTTDFEKFPAPGQIVDVDGLRMHIHCQGEGSPTVIAESGNGDFSLTWGLVQPEIAQLTRICVYDRAGYGWSESNSTPRTAHQMATELHSLIDNAEIEGPYILVGHSLGGLIVRMYASLYPEDVFGLVLVDATPEDYLERMPVEVTSIFEQQDQTRAVMQLMAQFGIFRLMGESAGEQFLPEHVKHLPEDQQKVYISLTSHPDFFATARAEMDLLAESCEQVGQMRDLGDLPLVVLSAKDAQSAEAMQAAGAPDDFPFEEIQASAQALQRNLASLSTNSTHMPVADSGHFIQLDRPEQVIEAVQKLLDQSRIQSSQ